MAGEQARALRALATVVVIGGAVAVVSVMTFFGGAMSDAPAWLPAAVTGLVFVASSAVVRVRIRSAVTGTAWTDAAILVAIVALPPAWVPLCVGLGVLIAKLVCRLVPFRAAYNAAKDALAATVGLLVAIQLGVAGATDRPTQLLPLAAVAGAVALTEYLIAIPVLSLASGTPWQRVLGANADIKAASAVGKFGVAVLTLKLYEVNGRLLGLVPLLALCLHLLYAGRVRARLEQATWQRLATTTEELNNTDLQAVLAATVVNASSLFAADEVEVFLRGAPDAPMLVRGDADGVRWSGDPGRAPPRAYDGESITARLTAHDRRTDLGEVRLHYAGRVTLTERERLTLRTFVSALRTAIRNATAFAETQRLAHRNAHEASHDSLTGLANRRRLEDLGAEVLARPGVAALVLVDLDHFREVNETLGLPAGDRLLTEVAARLERAAGPDDVIARLGGDAFAALLVGLDSPAAAEQRARELLATLDAAVDLDGMRVRVDASAGIAVRDETAPDETAPDEAAPDGTAPDGTAPDETAPDDTASEGTGSLSHGPIDVIELLRRADVATYHAKRGGRKIARYEVSRDTADLPRLMLGGDLPRAVAEREFTVHFQPIVDLATGMMISAEALTRWHHPDRGNLDPRRFLAAVERSGLRPAFAEVVLDQALAAMLRWRELGVDAPVAVNASPRSLLDPTFPRMVIARLEAHGVRGRDLIIELAESLTPSQLDLVGDVLREFREAGVRLALDDFGTGSSSLAMLAKIPVSQLKVDRSFVSAMASSPEAAAVVRTTIDLGRSLDLAVVAEGVENSHQRRLLSRLGCPAAQGHLFARPMPIEPLLDEVRTGRGGVRGRFSDPVPGSDAANVVELPLARRAEH